MKQIFLTSYFNSMPHPQRGDKNTIGLSHKGFVKQDSYEYIKPWYESIVNLGLEGIIFYDNLSKKFVDKYTNKNVSFIKVNRLGHTNNDERFFHYLNFCYSNRYQKVHLTDCCDVNINKDPYEFVTGRKLYICQDNMLFKDYSFAGVPIRRLINMEEDLELLDYPLLNMGVVSGRRDTILHFLSLMVLYLRIFDRQTDNLNMAIGNYIIRKHINNIFTGFPYCTEFKKNDTSHSYYFKHK